MKQLKWAITFQRGHDLPSEDREAGPVPVVTSGGVTAWHNVAKAVGPGIVTGRYGTIGEFHLVEQDYWPLNTALYSIDLHGNDPGFLRYMLEPLAPLFHVNAAKSAVPGVDRSDIHTIPVGVPPLPTQRVIAAFLDPVTARLDALVAAKEHVLELLAEKRRALITRAVTRGLDPHAPLRDSGIPWLGYIPSPWAISRLKFLATEPLAYGANEAALEDDPSFPRFVRITDVDSEGNLRDETFKSLPPGVAEAYLLRDGDVLFARSGATVGKAFIYKPSWGAACFAGYLVRCRCSPDIVQPDLIFAYTQSAPYWWQLGEGTIQATIQNFSAEKYGNLVVPLPPSAEQRAIVAHIAAETAKLDALRGAIERSIALLKERRAALIAAAVTGKIDVGGGGREIEDVVDHP
ncbi:MAG: restriction endonuclease subunit S [Deltaproteobacteria bacterium]|nr:restriction endonuclease subunit S [Deltaproteobacteria bacterium]